MPKLPSPRPLITQVTMNLSSYPNGHVICKYFMSFSDDTVSFPVTCETIIDVLPFPEPFPDTEPIPFVLLDFTDTIHVLIKQCP